MSKLIEIADRISEWRDDEDQLIGPAFDLLNEIEPQLRSLDTEPIDMLIFCPKCHKQHIDKPEPYICKCGHWDEDHFNAGERNICGGDMDVKPGVQVDCNCEGFEIAWNNPPHKTHACRLDYGGCGINFRIADVPTNGVEAIKTRGEKDTWPEASR